MQELTLNRDYEEDLEIIAQNNLKFKKRITLIIIGVLTLLYVIVEAIFSIIPRFKKGSSGKYGEISLSLLSDSFHNFSDVISIVVAYYALIKANSAPTDLLTFGWRRTEVVGALLNGSLLLSLCIYIVLDAVPRLIAPGEMYVDIGYLIVSGSGLLVNFIGMIAFWITGTDSHMHHDQEALLDGYCDEDQKNLNIKDAGIDISNNSSDDVDIPNNKINGASTNNTNSRVNSNDYGLGYFTDDVKLIKFQGFGSDVSNDSKLNDHESLSLICNPDIHKHTRKNNHKHTHKDHNFHSHGHDMNIFAVFIHYVGDAISSALVTIMGLIVYKYQGKATWTKYLDPLCSLLIVVIVLYSTIPFVKKCSKILLQFAPGNIKLETIRKNLLEIPGVLGLHDFHVWILVDGLLISSIHVEISSLEKWDSIKSEIKALLHSYNIHSSTIQPDFVETATNSKVCIENCEPNCRRDWCCKAIGTK